MPAGRRGENPRGKGAVYTKPDYERAREEAGFSWSVSASYLAYLRLTDTPIRRFFLEPDVCTDVFLRGRKAVHERFGEGVRQAGVSTPPISYGHVNTLGSELIFPEDGEVGQTRVYDSLERGIAALQEPVDFPSAGMTRFYLDFQNQLQRAFPDEPVAFAFRSQGPITTAYALRGHDIFTDVYDDGAGFAAFLALATDSIIAYREFLCDVTHVPRTKSDYAFLADDIASLFSPSMWPGFVVPSWRRFFEGITTGVRDAHVENLRAEHLRFLEEVGLSRYDPSISPQLNPKVISGNCRVPFDWLLGSFHYRDLGCDDIRDWVFQAVADGASGVGTHLEAVNCAEEDVPKVNAFTDACKHAATMLEHGASRRDVGREVSPAGRQRFWDHWPR